MWIVLKKKVWINVKKVSEKSEMDGVDKSEAESIDKYYKKDSVKYSDVIVRRQVDLKVVESEEGKSEIYLPNYISRYSVTSKNNFVSTFDYISKLTSNYQEENFCINLKPYKFSTRVALKCRIIYINHVKAKSNITICLE